MGRDYYDSFHSKSGNFKRKNPLPPRESEEQKRARLDEEARKEREHKEESDRRAVERAARHKQLQQDEDSRRGKTSSGHKKGQEGDKSAKRSADDQSSSKLPAAGTSVDIPSSSPPLPREDIQTIINRPKYKIAPGPPKLQATFPHWCLKGVLFDYDITPLDMEDMRNRFKNAMEGVNFAMDIAEGEIEKLHNWHKLVDQLQRVNRANQEAMLTMENDKAEWDKTLKERDADLETASNYCKELEIKVDKLQENLTASDALHKQKETLLQEQVKTAHAAQADVEAKLSTEQGLVKSLRAEIAQLREQTNSQALNNATLQARAEKAERERDEAIQAREKFKTEVNATLFEYYKQSIIHHGSLCFLDSDYPVTLAEVWEKIVAEMNESGYAEDELIGHLLDDKDRAALAKGRDQLARERAEAAGIGPSGLTSVPDPAPSIPDPALTTTTDAISTHSDIPPVPAPGPEDVPADDSSEKTASGNFGLDPVLLDHLINSYGPDGLYELYHLTSGLDTLPSSFSDLLTSDMPSTPPPPPPVAPSVPEIRITPILSQPGTQMERIAALDDFSDVGMTPEEGEVEVTEKTPLQKVVEDLQIQLGDESSSKKEKRRSKQSVSKKQKPAQSDKNEEDASIPPSSAKPSPPKTAKLVIKLDGNGKKK